MKKFVKGQQYHYEDDIEPISQTEDEEQEPDFQEEELGKWVCGERFLILRHTSKDLVISFMLVGFQFGQSLWECVHSDQK